MTILLHRIVEGEAMEVVDAWYIQGLPLLTKPTPT